MPCYGPDGPAVHQARSFLREEIQEELDKRKKVEAMLCACLTTLERYYFSPSSIFRDIDEVEAGITRQELETWWKDHKKQDQLRKSK